VAVADGVRNDGHVPAELGLAAVLAPVVERWRLLAVSGFLAAAVVAAIVLARAPRYQARIVMATVSNQPGLSSLGGAAALLGATTAQGGFQVSPALVASLLQSRRVLNAVGTSTLPGTRERVVDRIAGQRVAPEFVAGVMSRTLKTSVSKETGLVNLDVVLPDSALARLVNDRLLAATSRAYVETARAQASQLREAQEARVDSAARMLRNAEERLQRFVSMNRQFEQYSPRSMELQSLQRAVTLAEGIYGKAMNDRESAVAKELENTPAVVVVDPLPETLPRTPRRLALVVPLALLAAVFLSLVWIFLGEAFRRQARERTDEVERLRAALRTIPVVGSVVRRRAAAGVPTDTPS
jgi:uncharacterized protein involved in exopolysaccharide biosynthesis